MTNEQFQEKMFLKIREHLGELLTDEDLKPLVASAVERAFFEPREFNDGWKKVSKPPLFVEMIETAMKERVATSVDAWLKENPEVLAKAVDDVLKAGVATAVISHLNTVLHGPLWDLQRSLREKGLLNG